MESKEVGALIGKEVYWTANKCYADIVSYEKGWVTIKDDDDAEHKVRAKAIVLMDSDEDLVEGEEGLETAPVDPSSSSSEADSEVEAGPMEISCSCGLCFVAPKLESFQCPDCGAWHQVRLHPDLSRYIKGMAATASGRDTVDIDDPVATILRGLNLNELYPKICSELEKLDEKARFSAAMNSAFKKNDSDCSEFLQGRYAELNEGMQRMNLGNLLRGAQKRQDVLNLVADRKETPKPIELKFEEAFDQDILGEGPNEQ